MTNITSAPKERPNPYLAQIKDLCDDWQSAGQKTPQGFARMLEYILRLTILKPNSPGFSIQRSGSKSDFQISGKLLPGERGARPEFMPLELNNGCFLYVLYNLSIDRENKVVHTTTSKIRYQANKEGTEEIFRFDYERKPANHYPSAHLHIYGSLPEYVVLPGLTKKNQKKGLHHIHFPVIRPTLESVIRLLVNDYGVKTNQDPLDWGPVLEYTEQQFFRLFTPARSETAPPPYIPLS